MPCPDKAFPPCLEKYKPTEKEALQAVLSYCRGKSLSLSLQGLLPVRSEAQAAGAL